MGCRVSEAANSAQSIADDIGVVAAAPNSSRQAAQVNVTRIQELSQRADELQDLVRRFRV